jgi:hypothetical protein
MATLVPLPAGAPIPLDPTQPLRFVGADGRLLFVLAAAQRRWVLYDVSGASRVDARAVPGGATTLEDGALIRAGSRRLRFHAEMAGESGGGLCGFCRDAVDGSPAACSACGRAHHEACLAFAKRCGRCGVAR